MTSIFLHLVACCLFSLALFLCFVFVSFLSLNHSVNGMPFRQMAAITFHMEDFFLCVLCFIGIVVADVVHIVVAVVDDGVIISMKCRLLLCISDIPGLVDWLFICSFVGSNVRPRHDKMCINVLMLATCTQTHTKTSLRLQSSVTWNSSVSIK